MPVEVVEGEIPKELYGAFLRNGPNPCFEKAVKRYHWFDGHAMLVCKLCPFANDILYNISLTKPLYLSLHYSTLSIHLCLKMERQDIPISLSPRLDFQLRENWVSSSSHSLESTKVG